MRSSGPYQQKSFHNNFAVVNGKGRELVTERSDTGIKKES
jgi:hypothetical protein